MDKMIVVFGGNGRRFSINFKYDKSICELMHGEYSAIRRKCICTIVEEISESCKQRVEVSKEFSICCFSSRKAIIIFIFKIVFKDTNTEKVYKCFHLINYNSYM